MSNSLDQQFGSLSLSQEDHDQMFEPEDHQDQRWQVAFVGMSVIEKERTNYAFLSDMILLAFFTCNPFKLPQHHLQSPQITYNPPAFTCTYPQSPASRCNHHDACYLSAVTFMDTGGPVYTDNDLHPLTASSIYTCNYLQPP
ncbi:hypothetical protein RR48_15465 [Papilio machaon]|uniref:Uncharacterized protein n=1 Tax=Papilio machaon TaxID=76193 RepID=A0A194QVH5_PAPMA|nr:hypothetical protein RR48_15465 [Papilio machaon]